MINIKNLNFSYGESKILDNFNLEIEKGKVTAILGPSGCGKTTLLNIISGLNRADSGRVEMWKTPEISYIFQEPRLLPWLTVKENLLFTLKKLADDEANSRAELYLNKMGLTNHNNKKPGELSGGMAQRVSIARALAFPSDLILMDEPFKALDISLKINILKRFNDSWKNEERTALFVTHDIRESLLLGDVIIILSKAPINITHKIENPLKREKRSLYNPGLITLEKELFDYITKNQT